MSTKKTLEEAAREQELAKLQSLEGSVRNLRSENKRLMKQIGNWNTLTGEFVARAPSLPKPRKPRLTAKPAKRSQEVVALLSDSHFNSRWTRDKTDGATEYNFDIGCEHLWYYGQEILRVTEEDRGKYGLKRLHVDMLGDIFHGTLRVEDEVTNEFPSTPGLINTAWVLWQWLSLLAEHFEEVVVHGMAGNHGRNHQKPQSKRYVEENKDTLIYLMLQKFSKAARMDKRVRVIVPKSRTHMVERLGHRVKIGHGDHIRGGNSIAGLPIYGLSRDLLRSFRQEIKQVQEKKGIDLIQFGHWHQYSMLENTLILNGALTPTDPYAYDSLGAWADPCQLVYYTSREHVIGWSCPFSVKYGAGKGHKFAYDRDIQEAQS